MKKKWVTTTTYDRVQALMRHPKYLHDLKRLETQMMDEEEFCNKYSLRVPIKPEWISELLQSGEKEKIDSAELFVDSITEVLMNYDNQIGKPVLSKTSKGWSYYIREGKYLAIEIDLTRKKKDILLQLEKNIDIYQKKVAKFISRDYKTTIDPWEVYNMHKIKGMNFSKITQQLSGIKGNPTYDKKLKSWYSQVKRAYNKAEKMIAEIKHK